MDTTKPPYKPSRAVLVGILCISLILTYGSLPLTGYVLGFTMFSLLLVLDYAIQWEKERKEHAAGKRA